jgi:hypothetical protein
MPKDYEPKERVVKDTKPKFKPKVKPQTQSVARKTIKNVSLQSWSVPTGSGSVRLTPGHSVTVLAEAITPRVLNLRNRRLITIS